MIRKSACLAGTLVVAILMSGSSSAQPTQAQTQSQAQLTASYPSCADQNMAWPSDRKQKGNALSACIAALDRFARQLGANRTRISNAAYLNFFQLYKRDRTRIRNSYCDIVSNC